MSVWYNMYDKGVIIMEKWKDIEGFEGLYQVSNMGRVRSCFREGTKGGIIKQFVKDRYYKVHIYKNGKQLNFYTHRLVAKAFVINKHNKPEINHIDGNKLNNNANNLEWCNRQENMEHAYRNGLKKTIRVAQMKNGIEIKIFLNANRASKETGIHYASIHRCCNGIIKSAGGYQWKYLL